MEARLKKNSVAFQNIVQELSRYGIRNAPISLFFEGNRVWSQILDPTQVALCHVSFDPNKLFEEYQCNQAFDFVTNLWAVNKLFQKLEQDDDGDAATRLVIANEESEVLSVFVDKQDSFQQADLSLWDEDDQGHLDIEYIDYDCTVSMAAETFRQMMKICYHASADNSCIIKVTGEGISFTVIDGNFSSFTKCFRFNDNVTVRGEPNGHGNIHDVKHLYNIAKASIAPFVSLSVKTESPIKIEYDVKDFIGDQVEKVGSIQYHVAPRIDQEGTSLAKEELLSANTVAAKAFEACLADSSLFEQLILSACSIVYREAEMMISAEGIRFIGLNTCRKQVFEVNLSPEFFDQFHCSFATMRCQIDVQNFHWVLRDVCDEDRQLVLSLEGGCRDRLFVKSESPSKDEAMVHAIPLRDPPGDMPSVPKVEFFKSSVTIPSLLWVSLLKDLKGTDCTISICSNGILLETSSGDSRCLRSANNPNVVFDVREPTETVVLFPSLQGLGDLVKFGSTISLSSGHDVPLKIKCDLGLSQACSIAYYTMAGAFGKDATPKMFSREDIGAVSEKLQTCSEAMAPQETTAMDKPSKRKRKRARSTTRKPPAARKKAAPRTKPKLCSVCKQVKACSEFFPAHLRKTTKASCIDCLVVGFVTTMCDWREPRSFDGPDHVQAFIIREEVRRLRSLHLERYDCPTFLDYAAENDIGQCLQASFVPKLPELETLAGMYNIVYAYSRKSYLSTRTKQRGTKGNLCIQYNGTPGVEGLALRGRLETPTAIAGMTEPHTSSFRFAQTKVDGPSNPFEVPIEVTDYTRTVNTWIAEEGHTGTIRMLAKRTATGWNPNEIPQSKSVIPFETVKEAEMLTSRRNEMFIANSWIRNHLGLPSELALMIHDFVAFRPPLAFFFEKGDLWIDLKWKKPDGQNSHTILVARRCREEA